MRIFVSAGEASGDHLAASLIRAMSAASPGVLSWGMGGHESESCGMEVTWPSEALQLMGIGEVLGSIPRLLKLKNRISNRIAEEKPDAVIVVDSPDFHFPLLRQVRREGYRGCIVYLAPPQVWAWRSGRTAFLRETCDLCLPLFGFEHDFLALNGVRSAWTGHPFVDDFCGVGKPAGPNAENRRVALLPGSRKTEVERIIPVLLPTAGLLREKGYEPVFSIAPGLARKERERLLSLVSGFRTDERGGRAIMGESCCVVGASGTAAVEAMMLDRFMVVLYRVSLSSELVFRCFVRTPHVSIPNRLAEGAVYPELLQGNANPGSIMEALEGYLSGVNRSSVHESLERARSRMGRPGAADFWARSILESMGRA